MAQARSASAEDAPSQPPEDGEDFLIEPGEGAPQHAREARDLAQVIGPRTNPAVSVHIAAARRAAQAAMAESNAALNSSVVQSLASSERVQFAARGVQSARTFYASHRRTVLLGVAIVIAATLAVQNGRHAGAISSALGTRWTSRQYRRGRHAEGQDIGRRQRDQARRRSDRCRADRVDRSTAGQSLMGSILRRTSGPSAGELMAAIPPGVSASLRDAVAGRPAQCAI